MAQKTGSSHIAEVGSPKVFEQQRQQRPRVQTGGFLSLRTGESLNREIRVVSWETGRESEGAVMIARTEEQCW